MRGPWAGLAALISSVFLVAVACSSQGRDFSQAGTGGDSAGAGGNAGAGATGTGGSMSTAGHAGSSSAGLGGDIAVGGVGGGGDGGTGTAGGLENGFACSTDQECASGTCRDDVCCDQTCDGSCEACAETYTGQPNGSCSPVLPGVDPHDDCETSAGESCGNDGTCDGAGSCRKYGTNQVCANAMCSAANFSPARTCDGSGACEAATTTPCGDFPCSETGCEQPCSTDPDCPSGSYCGSQICRNKKSDGQACAAANECRSSHCVDGVCCETACTGTCAACSQAKTGQSSGQCVGVPGGQDPDNECAPDNANACGRDGACSGGGACRVRSLGTSCGTASCSGSTLTPQGSCDGASTCNAGSSQQCPNQLTCASATACRTSCTQDSHCTAGHFCSNGSCAAKKNKGAACTAGTQCSSGHCKDSVCCESACSLSCQACSNATTGLANGTCGARTSSTTKPCPSGTPTECINLQTSVDNCGSCGNQCADVPNTKKACTNGGCAWECTSDLYELACQTVGGKPNCSQWDFELPNQADGFQHWPPEAFGNPASEDATTSAPISSTAQHAMGSRSLAITYTKTSDARRYVDIKVRLCATGTGLNLVGKTIRWSLRSSTPMPSGGYNYVWFFEDPSLNTGSGTFDYNSDTSGNWVTYEQEIGSWATSVTGIGFHLEATQPWSGTLYLDDVRIY